MSGSGLMNILVCGLGLIGASLAKTLKKNTKHHIMGWNRTDSVSKRALSDGVIDEIGQLEDLMPKAIFTLKRLLLLSKNIRLCLRKTV